MKIKILIISIQMIFFFLCKGQDTIRVDESFNYTSEEVDKLTSKDFQGNYGREEIIYSQNHKRIEYCYYENNSRKCQGTTYKIEDSKLLIGDTNDCLETWNFYQLQNGNYSIYRKNNGFFEFGEVKELIPLKYVSPVYTTTINKLDTLWITTYFEKENRLNYWVNSFYQSELNEKIYEYYQIDTSPTQMNGEPIKNVEIESVTPCFSEPMNIDILTVAIIITKEGEIKNIEQAFGSLNDNCPFTMQEIIKQILTWEKLNPATKNGRKVNVRWFVKVDNLQRKYIHPVFEDNKKNRRKYIKMKK